MIWENSWWCVYIAFNHVFIVIAYKLVNAHLEPGLYCIDMNIWKIMSYYKISNWEMK